MGQPGLPGSQFPGEDSIARRIKDLERAVQQLSAANALATAGISAVPNGIVVNGNADFNGNMAVTGTLSLPAGIINNAALSSPIEPAAGHAEDYSFTITPTLLEKTRVIIPVPSGYSRALVIGTTTLSAYNSTVSDDNLYAGCAIQGTILGTSPGTSVKSLYTGAVSSSATNLLTGVSGSISIAGYASSFSGTWSGSTSGNIMNVSAMVMFLR